MQWLLRYGVFWRKILQIRFYIVPGFSVVSLHVVGSEMKNKYSVQL